MPSTDYLGASANPATDYLGDPFSFRTDLLDAGDAVVGAVFAEDEDVFGLVPAYGAQGVADGKTPAVQSAKVTLQQARRDAIGLKQAAYRNPAAKPRLEVAALQKEQQARKIEQALLRFWRRRQHMLLQLGADATAGVQGAGGLKFEVKSPSGIGRPTRVPFRVADAATPGTLSVLGDRPSVSSTGIWHGTGPESDSPRPAVRAVVSAADTADVEAVAARVVRETLGQSAAPLSTMHEPGGGPPGTELRCQVAGVLHGPLRRRQDGLGVLRLRLFLRRAGTVGVGLRVVDGGGLVSGRDPVGERLDVLATALAGGVLDGFLGLDGSPDQRGRWA